jgi:hypothetical protein
MGFSEEASRALAAKLSEKHVRHREVNGMTLSYVEGWHTIAEANRIFGSDAWNRETVSLKCVGENRINGEHRCSYIAKVRVTVRAGDIAIAREGTGAGHGTAPFVGEAHESASKEAETDAMKRALATFGNPFGLALYDPEKRNVRKLGGRKRNGDVDCGLPWVLTGQDGCRQSAYAKPVDLLAAMRRKIDAFKSAEKIEGFVLRNRKMLERLRRQYPELKGGSGAHYVSMVSRYAARKAGKLVAASKPINGARSESMTIVNKTRDVASGHCDSRRVRDKDHLRYVSSLPCVVCGRLPSQAHHLKHAQPRAMGLKVGDQWTVPLCNLHHRSLHDAGSEVDWWRGQKVEPNSAATQLWRSSREQSNKL